MVTIISTQAVNERSDLGYGSAGHLPATTQKHHRWLTNCLALFAFLCLLCLL